MSDALHTHAPNAFANSPLDRLDAQRKDTSWVQAHLGAPSTLFVPVWRGRNLVAGDRAAPAAAFLAPKQAAPHLAACPWALLGQHDGRTLFAIDLSHLDTPLEPGAVERFDDLRRVGGLLPEADAAILAHARGLMHWRTHHRFCSVCGAVCTPAQAGHVMECSGCGAHHFPRTDPAVIMLITHGERALLGMPPRLRDLRVFTTLAGFVEPGESLEEAVARETWEEAGIRVGNVCYRSSQPWPFPASIMLGFTAQALTTEITADEAELAEPAWFTREQAASQDGFILPPPMSIARRLIDEWLASGSQPAA